MKFLKTMWNYITTPKININLLKKKTTKMNPINKDEALKELATIKERAEALEKIIKDADKPKPVMERIRTFEDACKELNIDPSLDRFTRGEKDEIAYEKLKVIAKALNEGWIPNWNDSDEYKYAPWFDMTKKPGSGFERSLCYYWNSYSSVCSRLLYKSRDLALYAGKTFEKEYYDYLTI